MFTPIFPTPNLPPYLPHHIFPLTPTSLSHSVNFTFEEAAGAFTPMFPEWFTVVNFIFGAFHLFFSVWMLTEYFLINWKNFVLPQYFYYPIKQYVCVCMCVIVPVLCVCECCKHLMYFLVHSVGTNLLKRHTLM